MAGVCRSVSAGVMVGALLAAVSVLVGCGRQVDAPSPPVTGPVDDPAAANPQGCVERFEPGHDYFPYRAVLRHAEQATVEYGPHYKILTVQQPWAGAEQPLRYLLLLCGSPVPPGYDDHVLIEIPARSVVTLSTTELSHLVELGLVDRLVGHDEFDWVVSPEVRQRIASGAMVEVGSAPRLDVERLLALAPDLLLADNLGDPQQGLLPRLRQLGVPVALVPSFLETSPLGRAEWVVVTSLFFNREDRAERFFAAVAKRYQTLVETVRQALADGRPRPAVLAGGPIEDIWWVPGGGSYMARLLADAGASYPWADEATTGSLPLALESVLAKAGGAEIWIHPGRYASRSAMLAADPRLFSFRALREGRVYGNDARTNVSGGNAYWENGTVRPDLVLADLVEIVHPDLLSRDMTYHRLLPAGPGRKP